MHWTRPETESPEGSRTALKARQKEAHKRRFTVFALGPRLGGVPGRRLCKTELSHIFLRHLQHGRGRFGRLPFRPCVVIPVYTRNTEKEITRKKI